MPEDRTQPNLPFPESFGHWYALSILRLRRAISPWHIPETPKPVDIGSIRARVVSPADRLPPHSRRTEPLSEPRSFSGGAVGLEELDLRRFTETSGGRRTRTTHREPDCQPRSSGWRATWVASVPMQRLHWQGRAECSSSHPTRTSRVLPRSTRGRHWSPMTRMYSKTSSSHSWSEPAWRCVLRFESAGNSDSLWHDMPSPSHARTRRRTSPLA